ncbi:hypothetical protein V6N13_130640 [Hibiscus sabdariffa]
MKEKLRQGDSGAKSGISPTVGFSKDTEERLDIQNNLGNPRKEAIKMERQNKGFQKRNRKKNLQSGISYKCMAEEVTKLMENLQFIEEELTELGDLNMEQLGNLEGSEKWIVGNSKKKLGIVYRNPRRATRITEGIEKSYDERTIYMGKNGALVNKGKIVVSGGPKYRAKRTIQRKNEVCNPIAAKKAKSIGGNLIVEEDEVSEVTSPFKTNPMVEVASQHHREPWNC